MLYCLKWSNIYEFLVASCQTCWICSFDFAILPLKLLHLFPITQLQPCPLTTVTLPFLKTPTLCCPTWYQWWGQPSPNVLASTVFLFYSLPISGCLLERAGAERAKQMSALRMNSAPRWRGEITGAALIPRRPPQTGGDRFQSGIYPSLGSDWYIHPWETGLLIHWKSFFKGELHFWATWITKYMDRHS